MPTYNPNDFYPSSGAKIDSQGNVRNTADGFNADGSENVVLENRNVQEINLCNALAITDTNTHGDTAGIVSVASIAGKKNLFVINSHNQSLSLILYIYPSTGGSSIGSTSVTVPANSNMLITSSNISSLAEPLQRIYFTLQATTAPTSGSVSVWLEGSVV